MEEPHVHVVMAFMMPVYWFVPNAIIHVSRVQVLMRLIAYYVLQFLIEDY